MEQGVKQNIKFNKSYFLTITVEGWVDVFTRDIYRNIIIDSLRFCIYKKGLNVYAYVVMSNHIHMIANCNEPFQLQETIRDFKKFTAKRILAQIENGNESRKEWMLDLFSSFGQESQRHKKFKFWKSGNHAIELYNSRFTWNKVNYIHQNPVRANLVNKPTDWKYSSASNYIESESLVPEIILITPPLNYG